jgi:hypothetical protein
MTKRRPEISEIIERLEALSAPELSDAEWPDDSLLAVIRADSSGLTARLQACEILLRRDQEKLLGVIGAQTVANIYVSALQERATTDLNQWAFLGMGDLGPMGLHLVACGDRALTALTPLLDIKQSAGIYSGSKESKIGNSDHARVCDFAAFFISRIKGFPYSFQRHSIALRDAEIERLKKQLQESI